MQDLHLADWSEKLESSNLEAGHPSYWQDRWREGRTGWDLGGVHPFFPELMKQGDLAGLKPGAKILEPGCGRAHTGAVLAQKGYKVTAFDVSGEAIEAAKSLYSNVANLDLLVADVFDLPPSWNDSFDGVYDRAVLCALPKASRAIYIETCARILRSGGLFLSIPFTKLNITESEGPPFAVGAKSLNELLMNKFEKVFQSEKPHLDIDSKISCEMLIVWRKK